MSRVTFAFAPDLRLQVDAERDDVIAHFIAEFGPAVGADVTAPEVAVTFGPVESPTIEGGHKSVRWRVALDEPTEHSLRATVELRGQPRGFGLSLVQGYFLEPLVALAAARRGRVLLPCAAIATADDGLMLLLGRSRSGKSTLAVRSLPGGAVVFGDDQAFVDASCTCTRFPRRMRFYSDLRQTAPRAFARLSPRVRAALIGRGVVRSLTRGFAAPPVRVPIEDIGTAGGMEPVPVRRVVLLERVEGIATIGHDAVGADETAEFALALLDEQREKLAAAGEPWTQLIRTLRSAEGAMLRAAFRVHGVERLRVPMGWTATDSLPVLAHLLRLPS